MQSVEQIIAGGRGGECNEHKGGWGSGVKMPRRHEGWGTLSQLYVMVTCLIHGDGTGWGVGHRGWGVGAAKCLGQGRVQTRAE